MPLPRGEVRRLAAQAGVEVTRIECVAGAAGIDWRDLAWRRIDAAVRQPTAALAQLDHHLAAAELLPVSSDRIGV